MDSEVLSHTDRVAIALVASCGAVCVLSVASVFCCVKSQQRKTRSQKDNNQFPKFRIVDAPNPNFLNGTKDDHHQQFNGNVSGRQEEVDVGKRLPARLPSNDAINDKSGSEYSYALPSEFRALPFLGRHSTDDSSLSDRDRESTPIHFKHRISTDVSQMQSKMENYGSTLSSPSNCADYTSPISTTPVCTPPVSTSNLDCTNDLQAAYMTPATNEESLYIQIKSLKVPHIDRSSIEVQGELGSGNFGCVVRCIYNETPSIKRDAASKTLKEKSETTDKIRFLQEAAIMGQFHHPNVVKMYGVVVTGTPLMIVLELMPKGDLRNFLVQIKPDQDSLPELLLQFCKNIASGMEYLSKKSFIHRDLAARNILLSKSLTCKIGDFGLARDLMDEDYYISHGGLIPMKWTAPEALNFRKYSTASDVWSYSCLLYEIWSLGHKPYGRKSNKETLVMIEEGSRLPPPPGCTRQLYHLMIECWHPDPSCRPTFTEILSLLNDADVLSWSESNQHRHNGHLLGSPLSSSESLFLDLQLTYCS